MADPGHYPAAERLLEKAESPCGQAVWMVPSQGQVHATLALAVATASDSDNGDWGEFAGGRFGRA